MSTEINNETLGQATEKVICDLSGLDSSHLSQRSNNYYEKKLMPIVKEAIINLPKITRHL